MGGHKSISGGRDSNPGLFCKKNWVLADDQPQNLTSRPSEAQELVRAAKPRLMKSAVAARCIRYIPIPADPAPKGALLLELDVRGADPLLETVKLLATKRLRCGRAPLLRA